MLRQVHVLCEMLYLWDTSLEILPSKNEKTFSLNFNFLKIF